MKWCYKLYDEKVSRVFDTKEEAIQSGVHAAVANHFEEVAIYEVKPVTLEKRFGSAEEVLWELEGRDAHNHRTPLELKSNDPAAKRASLTTFTLSVVSTSERKIWGRPLGFQNGKASPIRTIFGSQDELHLRTDLSF